MCPNSIFQLQIRQRLSTDTELYKLKVTSKYVNQQIKTKCIHLIYWLQLETGRSPDTQKNTKAKHHLQNTENIWLKVNIKQLSEFTSLMWCWTGHSEMIGLWKWAYITIKCPECEFVDYKTSKNARLSKKETFWLGCGGRRSNSELKYLFKLIIIWYYCHNCMTLELANNKQCHNSYTE